MTTAEVETAAAGARAVPRRHAPDHLGQRPQFIARDFKEFIRLLGMTHARTSPYYRQSNGKLERYQQTLKVTTIRPHRPASLEGGAELG